MTEAPLFVRSDVPFVQRQGGPPACPARLVAAALLNIPIFCWQAWPRAATRSHGTKLLAALLGCFLSAVRRASGACWAGVLDVD